MFFHILSKAYGCPQMDEAPYNNKHKIIYNGDFFFFFARNAKQVFFHFTATLFRAPTSVAYCLSKAFAQGLLIYMNL